MCQNRMMTPVCDIVFFEVYYDVKIQIKITFVIKLAISVMLRIAKQTIIYYLTLKCTLS